MAGKYQIGFLMWRRDYGIVWVKNGEVDRLGTQLPGVDLLAHLHLVASELRVPLLGIVLLE